MGHSKEIWDASGYDKTSGQQYRDAKETIDKILQDNLGQVDIILDIGCGCGNSTKMLSSYVPHKKIYACDFDAQMISYANEKHNDGTIEYFVQNFDLPWDKLDQRLKDLEGKVDLVWSNRCLHWVSDKANAAKIIGRLLKPGGRCYVNTTLTRDLFEFCSEEEKQEYLKDVDMQTHQQQFDEWKQVFGDCGLSQVNVEMLFKDWFYPTEEDYIQMEGSALGPYFMRLVRKNVSQEKRQELAKKFVPKFHKAISAKYGENFEQMTNYDKRQIYYEQFRIIGTK